MTGRQVCRLAVIAPHFYELAYRYCIAAAAHADVLLVTDVNRLNAEFKGLPMPAAQRLSVSHMDFRSPLDTLRLPARLRYFAPETLHIHEPSGRLRAVICAWTATIMGSSTPVVLEVHDPSPHEGHDSKVVRRIGWLRPYLRKRAKAVIVHGEQCRQEYLRVSNVPGQKVLSAEIGVQLCDGRPRPSKICIGPLCVLAFGRMEKYKGLGILCSAAELLQERKVDVKIRICGGGPDMDRFGDRLRKIPIVTVESGFAPAAKLVRALQDADCVVMPYFSATQSGILSAAFGNGRFVIASRVGGLQDVIVDGVNGIFVPPGDPVSLADALERVSGDAAFRIHLSDGAARTAAERMQWDSIVKEIWFTAYG